MDGLVQENLVLRRGSLVRIADGRDLLVQVTAGSVWLTQEGDPRDYRIGAGGKFRIASRGLTLISGLGRSAVVLTSRVRRSLGERINLLATPAVTS
jgi:hypothetical protein